MKHIMVNAHLSIYANARAHNYVNDIECCSIVCWECSRRGACAAAVYSIGGLG